MLNEQNKSAFKLFIDKTKIEDVFNYPLPQRLS